MKDRRFIGYKNRATGDFGQDIAKAHLERIGYRMVERVHTPWKVIFANGAGGRRRVVAAFPMEKVSGDFRAVEPMTGRNVLVEVKTNENSSLPWSAFEDHQTRALEENHVLGGISLIAWVKGGVTMIYRWPVADFVPGKSIKPL
jgi:hypothetical protein